MNVKHISIIGAGTMGNGIAHVFAQYGYTVTLIDVSQAALDKALLIISKNLDRQVNKELITPTAKAETLARITTHTDIEDAVKNADLIVEAATEQVELKKQIFKNIAQWASPHCILATNTSSISITLLAAETPCPQRVIGMHFMNPVPVMKLVEVINGYNTDCKVTETILNICQKIEKTPCVVNDYPGFIANRILMPMVNEAIYSLYEGVAGVEAIDTVMKLGMAHPMGPLQLADFIGLDTCASILKIMQHGLGNQKYAPCPLLINMVQAGKLGVKTGEGFYIYEDGKKIVSPKFLKP